MRQALASEILGFSPHARVLLINADDLGMHPAINHGVLAALDRGIARSTSLMTTCPASRDAIDMLRRRPDIAFGVHLTLVRDLPADDWTPRAPAQEVPSLVDASGRLPLHAQAADLLRNAEAEEVATEFRAQLMTVLDEGLSPTHLDFHSLADGGRPDLLDAAADLAAGYGLALRVWLEPGRTRARRAGLPVVDHPFLDSFTLDTASKADRYEQLLRALPPGLTEWAVHPALDDSRASVGDPDGWRVRTTDHEFLTSRRAAAIIREEGITLIDHRPLQRLWRTGGGLSTWSDVGDRVAVEGEADPLGGEAPAPVDVERGRHALGTGQLVGRRPGPSGPVRGGTDESARPPSSGGGQHRTEQEVPP